MGLIRNIAKINDTDIADLGAMLVKGAYEELLTPPAMKQYITNESRLVNGSRYVATAETARTTSRTVSLQFFIVGTDRTDYIRKLQTFMDLISKFGQINFQVTALGCIYKLVYTKCSSYGNFGKNRGKFTVQFVEPDTSNRIYL